MCAEVKARQEALPIAADSDTPSVQSIEEDDEGNWGVDNFDDVVSGGPGLDIDTMLYN